MNLYGYAGGDPINNADPFGLSVVGKIVALTVRAAKTIMKGADEAALIRNAVEGEDVVVGSEAAARQIARAAGGGRRPIGPEQHRLPGGETGRPHYHPADRPGGHVFYGIASGLTVSHYAQGKGAFLVGAAAVADLVNPLSTVKDALDIYALLKPAERTGGGGGW